MMSGREKWLSSRLSRALGCLVLLATGGLLGFGPHASLEVLAASPPAFSGTAETTYTLTGLAPAAPTRLTGRYRIVSTWSARDPNHWRLDSRTVSPVLQRGTKTLIANGSSLVQYESILHRAQRTPLGASATYAVLGYFLGGESVGIVQEMGSGYFTYLRSHGGHTRLVRQVQMLGRTVNEYEISPLASGSTGGKPTSSGHAFLWLDQQYPIVLRLALHFGRGEDQPQHWLYRVTSLTLGQGPAAGALSYQPPVKPRQAPSSVSSSGGGSAGPHARWQVPKGFIAAGTPAGYTLAGAAEAQDPLWNGPSTIQALFTRGSAFLYVEEQVRASGLPAALRSGKAAKVGGCRVWTGSYAGTSLRRIALRRGHISLLAVTNGLTAGQLRDYAARNICA